MGLPTGLGQRALQSLNRPSALQFIGTPQMGAPATQPVPQNIMGLRKKVLEQQMRPQITPAQQFAQMTAGLPAMERTPAPDRPKGLGGLLSGMIPEAGTPEMAGIGAAGQKLLELSGYRQVPITTAEALGQAAGAFTQARGAALQQQREEAAAQAAAERQAILDKQAREKDLFDRMMREQEFGLKQKKEAREAKEADKPKEPKYGYQSFGGKLYPTKDGQISGDPVATAPDNITTSFKDIKMPDGTTHTQLLNSKTGELIRTISVSKQEDEPTARTFQNIGAYFLDGKFLGEASYDTRTGERTYVNSEGVRVPLPPEAQPVTESFMGKGVLTAEQMSSKKGELVDLKNGLTRYTNYLENIEKANVGITRLADEMSSYFKTLLSTKAKAYNLTEEELALRVAQGEFQGLLGGARIDTVGGGVMTEQDALRIIQNLGGDVSLLQNSEVVKDQISRMFTQKYNAYNSKRDVFNSQVERYYKGFGYKTLPELDVNTELLSPKYLEEMGLQPTAKETKDVSEDVSDITYTEDELNNALDKYN